MQILAILFAVFITYLFWAPLEKLSPGSVLLAIPAIEEGAKAVAAWSFAVSIFPLHFGFGLAEAIWELSRKKKAAAVAALLTHSSFGFVALWASAWGRFAALGAALLLHGLWNFFIYRLQLQRGS